MKKKSIIKYFAFFAIAIGCIFTTAFASGEELFSTNATTHNVYNWSGKVTSSKYSYLTNPSSYATKGSANFNTTAIKWSTSTGSGVETVWFQIVNSDGFDRGTVSIEGPNDTRAKGFFTTAEYGYWYWLTAKRESYSGTVTIGGTWAF